MPPNVEIVVADVADEVALRIAMAGCDAVIDCAGINREVGRQTYRRVHTEGARIAVSAAREAGVRRFVLVSFLRARPNGPSAYHRSKWAAEEIVESSGLEWTAVRPGIVYGRGDHMLDHLSRAFVTFPVFGLVGRGRTPMRPLFVGDLARILGAAALGDDRLRNRTVAALGPEEMSFETAARRVAAAVGRSPIFVPLPVAVHRVLAVAWEATMRVPLLSRAQVEILAETLAEPALPVDPLPPDLRSPTLFTQAVVASQLPARVVRFGRGDLRTRCR